MPRPASAGSAIDEGLDGSILVVDDDDNIRELIAEWLATIGYRVVMAANAEEALAQVRRTPPAVAVCDIRMFDLVTGLSGWSEPRQLH